VALFLISPSTIADLPRSVDVGVFGEGADRSGPHTTTGRTGYPGVARCRAGMSVGASRGPTQRPTPEMILVGDAGQASMTLQTDCWVDTIGLSAVPIELSSAIPSGSASNVSMNLP
jgi:hypothetical protein